MQTLSRPKLTLKRPMPGSSATSTTAQEALARARFWFVWCPTASRPKKRHASAEAAYAEATRLRGIDPDREFLVFEAHCIGSAG